jgi:hypothetical protein
VRHQLAQALAFWFAIGVGVAAAATPSTIPDTLITAPPGLTAVARKFVTEGTNPTAFNKYVGRDAPFITAFLEAWVPQGYRVYRLQNPDIAGRYVVITTPRNDSFVVYGAGGYFMGWEPVNQRLARVEQYVTPALRGYQKRELRNAVLYSAPGKPAVELLVTEGMPSMTHHANFSISMLVFPTGVTVLTLDSPCDFWTVTPPPSWPKRLNPRDCIAKWVEVVHS